MIEGLLHVPKAFAFGKTRVKSYFHRFKNYVSGYYEAGRRDIRSVKSWQPRLLSSDEEYAQDYDLIRARSRDLYRNKPHGRAVINRFVTAVIGRGLRLQPTINYEALGLSLEQASAWEKLVEAKFHLWAKSKSSDINEQYSFYSLQTMAYKAMLKDGDVFALLPSKPSNHSPFNLKIRLISSMSVASPTSALPTDMLILGVEKNKSGGVTHYHIKESDGSCKRVPLKGSNTGRLNIIHVFDPDDIDQTRGLPILYPVIILIKDMETYFRAELQASMLNTFFSVILKDTEDDGLGGQMGAGQNETDISNFKLGPGSVIGLPSNKDIEIVNAARPISNFAPYIDSLSNAISMGSGLPDEVFRGKFMSSYSAARAAILDFKQNKEVKRSQFVSSFCEPIYNAWLYEQVLLGEIVAPGFLENPEIRGCYTQSSWVGDSTGQIDEVKEVNAIEKRLLLGLTTYEKEAAQLNGTHFADNVATLRREVNQLNQLKTIQGEKEVA